MVYKAGASERLKREISVQFGWVVVVELGFAVIDRLVKAATGRRLELRVNDMSFGVKRLLSYPPKVKEQGTPLSSIVIITD